MRKSRFSEDQIIAILKESGDGRTVPSPRDREGVFLPVEEQVRRQGGCGNWRRRTGS